MIRNFSEAKKYIFDHIPKESFMFQGDEGFKRSKNFLNFLDNPQETFKSIHIAGTSGKGSTATILSSLLHSQGFKVGLLISPHIVDVRERIQINNAPISEVAIIEIINSVHTKIKEFESKSIVTYFDLLFAIACKYFQKEKVDYVVIETGMGGLLDTTNTITRKDKLCVINQIGFDHMKFLGETIEEITQQKLGIVNNHQLAISIDQNYEEARSELEKFSLKNKNELMWLKSNEHYKNIILSDTGSTFDFEFQNLSLKDFSISLLGKFQIQNCSLALAALATLSKVDNWKIDKINLQNSAKKITFPGRFEIKKLNKSKFIIDGAHNEQKMKAFTESLKLYFPKRKFIFIVAFKKDKQVGDMLKHIIPLASKIIITKFETDSQDLSIKSLDSKEILSELTIMNFQNIEVIYDHKKLKEIMTLENEHYVITGSLYLVSSLYNLFD